MVGLPAHLSTSSSLFFLFSKNENFGSIFPIHSAPARQMVIMQELQGPPGELQPQTRWLPGSFEWRENFWMM